MRKLSDLQIAELRAWWARRQEALRLLGSVSSMADEYGVGRSIVSRVVNDPAYRPTSAAMAARVRHELPSDFTVTPRLRS